MDLHTDHGTIFTDFNLHGTAKGEAETIGGNLGSAGARSIYVRVKNGTSACSNSCRRCEEFDGITGRTAAFVACL